MLTLATSSNTTHEAELQKAGAPLDGEGPRRWLSQLGMWPRVIRWYGMSRDEK